MRALFLAVGLALLASACAATEAPGGGAAGERGGRLTIERLLAQPSLTGTSPRAPAWSPDSRHLAFLWNDEAMPRREVWVLEADGTDYGRSPEGRGQSRACGSLSGRRMGAP